MILLLTFLVTSPGHLVSLGARSTVRSTASGKHRATPWSLAFPPTHVLSLPGQMWKSKMHFKNGWPSGFTDSDSINWRLNVPRRGNGPCAEHTLGKMRANNNKLLAFVWFVFATALGFQTPSNVITFCLLQHLKSIQRGCPLLSLDWRGLKSPGVGVISTQLSTSAASCHLVCLEWGHKF